MELDQEAFEAWWSSRPMLNAAKSEARESWLAGAAYARRPLEPIPRDEARFRHFAPEPRAEIPPGTVGELFPRHMVWRDGVLTYPPDGSHNTDKLHED